MLLKHAVNSEQQEEMFSVKTASSLPCISIAVDHNSVQEHTCNIVKAWLAALKNEDSRCARPSIKAPIDSLMTNTVAMDMMTAQTMTATVSSLVRPTGNCMQTSTGSVSSRNARFRHIQHAKTISLV
jgi:hypothetical protein